MLQVLGLPLFSHNKIYHLHYKKRESFPRGAFIVVVEQLPLVSSSFHFTTRICIFGSGGGSLRRAPLLVIQGISEQHTTSILLFLQCESAIHLVFLICHTNLCLVFLSHIFSFFLRVDRRLIDLLKGFTNWVVVQ